MDEQSHNLRQAAIAKSHEMRLFLLRKQNHRFTVCADNATFGERAMRMAQTDYELTAEEEAQMELDYHLERTRWPIEDEDYLEALDAAAVEVVDAHQG
jgi:hypothetical protein